MEMRITVLGGAGKMGCIAVQSLAGDERVDQVILAEIKVQKTDSRDPAGLVEILRGSDTCLNATVYYTNLDVMQACLEAGAHYTDMGGLFHTTYKQLSLSETFAQAGLSAVLGMGSAPGIPNIQARYAAERLDKIESIRIYDGIKPPSPDDVRFTYAVPTILDELTLSPMVFENGEFTAKEPLTGFEDYWFSAPMGTLPMHYSLHSEVATLPLTYRDKGVQECFFKINYWGMAKETVEKVRILADFGFNNREAVEVNGQQVIPRDLMLALLSEYVPPITDFLAPATKHPPDWVKEIVTEVRGSKDRQPVTYRLGTLTCKGALPTGLAPAIAAIWLAQGRIPAGVHPPEAVLEPEPFFKELEPYEIETRVTVTSKV
jgi:saccharopine dehydrogenase-like NADP-dependent oxidoreductase